jgi:hypothetical protein
MKSVAVLPFGLEIVTKKFDAAIDSVDRENALVEDRELSGVRDAGSGKGKRSTGITNRPSCPVL